MSPTTASRSCRRPTRPWPTIADQPAPVDYDNYYGLLERDREKMRSNIVTFALEHDLTDAVRISNTTRYGHATRDFDLFVAALPQHDHDADHAADPVARHGRRDPAQPVAMSSPSSPPARSATTSSPASKCRARRAATSCATITAGTPTDLFDPDPERPWVGTIVDIPATVVRARADTVAAYLFDTIHFSEQIAGHRRPALGALQERASTGAVAAGRDRARPHRPQPDLARRPDLQAGAAASASMPARARR